MVTIFLFGTDLTLRMHPSPKHQEGLPQQLPGTSPLGPHPRDLLQGLPLAQLGPQLFHVLHHVTHVPERTRHASDSGHIILSKNCQHKFWCKSNQGNVSDDRTKDNVCDNSYPDKNRKQNFRDILVNNVKLCTNFARCTWISS